MTLTTLVTGNSAAAREVAIVAALSASTSVPPLSIAFILEGLPDGSATLENFVNISAGSATLNGLAGASSIVRIAPGCMCCTGNLTMRVTLNRTLQRHPSRLFISLATSEHLISIRSFLTQTPYDAWLSLTDDLRA